MVRAKAMEQQPSFHGNGIRRRFTFLCSSHALAHRCVKPSRFEHVKVQSRKGVVCGHAGVCAVIGEHFDVRLLRPRRRPLLLLLCAIRQNDGARARALKLERSCTRHTHTLSNYIYIACIIYSLLFGRVRDPRTKNQPCLAATKNNPHRYSPPPPRLRHASATPPPRLCGAPVRGVRPAGSLPPCGVSCACSMRKMCHICDTPSHTPTRAASKGKEGGGCVRVTPHAAGCACSSPQQRKLCYTLSLPRDSAAAGLSTCWRPSHSRACRQV